MEDELIQVDAFYYPINFIMLNIEQSTRVINEIPIILGKPFLATSNSLINCRNGLMQLTFGNMTMEVNIFNLAKKLKPYEDDPVDVFIIYNVVEERVDNLMGYNLEKNYDRLEEAETLFEPS